LTGSTLSKYFTERVIQVATFDIGVTDEILPTQSGLALLGLLLSKTNLTEKLNWLPTETGVDPEIPNSDIAKSYIGVDVRWSLRAPPPYQETS